MNIWINSMIAATSLAATIAVVFAGTVVHDGSAPPAAVKSDRLAIAEQATENMRYVTVESRGEQISVLSRVTVTLTSI